MHLLLRAGRILRVKGLHLHDSQHILFRTAYINFLIVTAYNNPPDIFYIGIKNKVAYA